MLELDLKSSYEQELNKFLLQESISTNDIKNSLEFFEKDSLLNSSPLPKKLEVVAIVSGIPFEKSFQRKIIEIQSILSKSLANVLHYNVKPDNFAVEYLVLKWPFDSFPKETVERTKSYLKNTKLKKFNFKIVGVQMHQDGCMLLQGISEDMMLHKIREDIVNEIPNFPKKQSKWAHVPLGRFLEPITTTQKNIINEVLVNLNRNFSNFHTNIETLHLINEHRWYMEEISYIYKKNLN